MFKFFVTKTFVTKGADKNTISNKDHFVANGVTKNTISDKTHFVAECDK